MLCKLNAKTEQGNKHKERNCSGITGGVTNTSKQCKQSSFNDLDTLISGLLDQVQSVVYSDDSELRKSVDTCKFFVGGVGGRIASDDGDPESTLGRKQYSCSFRKLVQW